MRLTIIPIDNAVYVDGVVHELDLTTAGIPADVHALQWFDARGWIEFNNVDPFTPKLPNEEINALPTWANNCVLAWEQWTPPAPPVIESGVQPISTGTQTL